MQAHTGRTVNRLDAYNRDGVADVRDDSPSSARRRRAPNSRRPGSRLFRAAVGSIDMSEAAQHARDGTVHELGWTRTRGGRPVIRRALPHRPELDALFTETYKKYRPGVRSVIYTVAGPGTDVDAVAHDTFLRYLQILREDGPVESPWPLLRRIASGKAVDAVRVARRSPWAPAGELPEDNGEWTSVSRTLGPDRALEIAEVLREINSLNAELRWALLLREYLGLSRTETADALGIAPASVSASVRRAKKKLRERAAEAELPSPPHRMEGGSQ